MNTPKEEHTKGRIGYAVVGDLVVSTMKLLPCCFRGETDFSTIVISHARTHYCERYESASDALLGHNRVVAQLEAGLKPEGWYGEWWVDT